MLKTGEDYNERHEERESREGKHSFAKFAVKIRVFPGQRCYHGRLSRSGPPDSRMNCISSSMN